MGIDDVARVAVRLWSRADSIIMVAISGAESAFATLPDGDHLSIFTPALQEIKRPYACNGYTSFGAWQIHTPAHHARLQELTGSVEPCVWRGWLLDLDHNGQIAAELVAGAGFIHWTTYNNRSYRAHLHDAELAVDRALAEVGPPGPPIWPPPPPPGVVPVSVSLLYVRATPPPPVAVGAFRALPPVVPAGW